MNLCQLCFITINKCAKDDKDITFQRKTVPARILNFKYLYIRGNTSLRSFCFLRLIRSNLFSLTKHLFKIYSKYFLIFIIIKIVKIYFTISNLTTL